MGKKSFRVSGNIVDVVGKRIFKGEVTVENGIIKKITEGPSGKEMFSDYGYGALHLSLVLGHSHLGRVRHKTKVPFHVGVGPVYGRVVDVGLHYT